MKYKTVLIIIPHLSIGGTEAQTLSLVKALINAGYKVVVLCLYRHVDQTVKKYQEIGVQLMFLSPEYDKYGIKINYQKGLDLIKFLHKGLKQAINQYNPDIFHVQYMTPASTIILLLKYFFHKNNIIATSHTFADIYSPKNLKLVKYISKYCLRGFQCISVNAEKSYFSSSNLFNPEIKLKKHGNHFTIHNSLPDYINIRKNEKESKQEIALNEESDTREKNLLGHLHSISNTITIGVVSRLERIKGMDLVLPAFAQLYKKYPNTRLLIVGDGSLRSEMEKQTQKFGLDSESIIFTGRQTQDKLQDLYDKIDILLMPSRSEGFGLTAVEGMARGCVPVVSNIGGLPEVVREGVDGLVHKKEDIEDMVAKIKLLLDDKNLLEKLSAKAIKRSGDFSEEHYNTQICAWYESL